MTERPMRGKRGAERRLVERITTEYAARQAQAEATAVDFEVAEVDSEVADARRRDATTKATAAMEAARAGGHQASDQDIWPPGEPDCRPSVTSSARPVGAAAAFRRERLVRRAPPADRRTRRSMPPSGRHAGLTTIPHGAKSFLGAALAATGERSMGRPRLRDRRPPRRGARRLAGRSRLGRDPRAPGRRWPTSGASSSLTKRRPASRPWRPGGAAPPGSSWRASRRFSSTRSPRTTCPLNRAG